MKRIVRLTESDLTRIVKRVISETNFLKRTFLGEPSKDDIEYAMDEVENSNDRQLKNVIKDLYDAYMNKSETDIMYQGDEVTMDSSDVKKTFFEIVKGISKNGIKSIKIGIKPGDDDENFMWVKSEKHSRWGDHMYKDDMYRD
jgi:hypothetical protein